MVRQLGERDDVAPGMLGPVVGVGQPREVAVEVADGQVQLGERDTQHRHGVRLPIAVRRPVLLGAGGSGRRRMLVDATAGL